LYSGDEPATLEINYNCSSRIETKPRFIAITQNIDTDNSNPMARFFLHILAAFAELERELIRERVTPVYVLPKHEGAHRPTEAYLPTRRTYAPARGGDELAEYCQGTRS
jgi:Resolvase, N terminal domain